MTLLLQLAAALYLASGLAGAVSLSIAGVRTGRVALALLGTAALAHAASFIALPVSTTHVSTGGIVGIGGATGSLRWSATSRVLAAWLTTVPLAAAIGALAMWGLS